MTWLSKVLAGLAARGARTPGITAPSSSTSRGIPRRRSGRRTSAAPTRSLPCARDVDAEGRAADDRSPVQLVGRRRRREDARRIRRRARLRSSGTITWSRVATSQASRRPTSPVRVGTCSGRFWKPTGIRRDAGGGARNRCRGRRTTAAGRDHPAWNDSACGCRRRGRSGRRRVRGAPVVLAGAIPLRDRPVLDSRGCVRGGWRSGSGFTHVGFGPATGVGRPAARRASARGARCRGGATAGCGRPLRTTRTRSVCQSTSAAPWPPSPASRRR